jgi:hypothetical protein
VKPKIFISYRRDDGGYIASTLTDSLAARFGRDAVVMDFRFLDPGASFRDAIEEALRSSTVVVAVIGPAWLSAKSRDGRRRLDDPGDFVRTELETALALRKPVIPVLVGGVLLPAVADLPTGLRRLANLQAVEIRSGRDAAENTAQLVQAIERFVAEADPDAPILKAPIRSRGAEPHPPQRAAAGAKGKPVGSVFISYRREGGAETARLMRYELLARGWRAFLDVEDLKAGHFDEELLAQVAAADNFLLVVSKDALEGCAQESDWLRKEILKAIETGRNIVPLLKEQATPPGKQDLPDEMRPIGRFNCVDYSHVYYDATIARLLSFLKRVAG